MSKIIDSRLIGQTIKALRLSKNWTQDYLADIVGYSVRNLRRIENDGTGSIDVVNTFADIFEVSAIDILSGDVFCLHLKTPHSQIYPGFVGFFCIFAVFLLSFLTCLKPILSSLISLTLSRTILGASVLSMTSFLVPKK